MENIRSYLDEMLQINREVTSNRDLIDNLNKSIFAIESANDIMLKRMGEPENLMARNAGAELGD